MAARSLATPSHSRFLRRTRAEQHHRTLNAETSNGKITLRSPIHWELKSSFGAIEASDIAKASAPSPAMHITLTEHRGDTFAKTSFAAFPPIASTAISS